ncbi:hypothetical protein K4F52_001813 [Lecanicillium sp. MT-2017a]|nr:hypothetical protein K4F52_001813 [Lecanicillium sp. MT-2017a]
MDPAVLATAANAVQARKRIQQHIYQTPLLPSRVHSGANAGDTRLLFKAENFQLTGSFKIRGAMSKMSAHSSDGALITASSGNHGIGAAVAAKSLSKKLTVVLPETVVPAKLEKIRSQGVEVILHGAETGLAEQHAQKLAATEGYAYVSPYNDAHIVAGQGTIALELLEQCAQIDNVFIAMGGGGLISGIGSVLKAFSPQTKIYGVSAKNSMALAESMKAGRVVETEHLNTLAEAVAGGMDEDSITLPLAMAVVDEVIVCTEEDMVESLKVMAFKENMLVEGAAALALAGFDKVKDKVAGQTSVVVLCGGNYDQGVLTNAIFGK